MSAEGLHPTFVVLGMHRSGTSAVAGALARRGANAGSALLPSTSDNANGYFEDARLVAASDLLLAAGGLRWDEPGPVPRPLDPTAVDTALARLGDVFATLRDTPTPALVKDPRACRLVPEWSQAMDRAGLEPLYLIVLRDPREVAASLSARDGMSAFRAAQLWLEHLLEAEYATRGARRVFVGFSELVQGPDAVVDAALSALGMGTFGARDASRGTGVEPGLRRHHAAVGEGEAFADDVFAFARRLLGTDGADAATAAVFDGFRARWRETAHIARSALADAEHRALQAREDETRLAREVRRGAALVDAWGPAPPRVVAPRVYWRSAGDDYSEDRSRGASRPTGEAWSVALEGGSAAVDFLRIDPDERAGVFEVRALRVAGSPLPLAVTSVVRSNGILRASGDHLMLVALDDDPWLEFAVSVPDAVAGSNAGFELELDIVCRGLPELLWSLVQQEALGAARLRTVESSLDMLGQRADALALRTEHLVAMQAETLGALQRGLAEQSLATHEAFTTQSAEVSSLRQALESVSRQSAEILGWTRRRTFRYWWRRWRGSAETPEGTS